MLKKIEKVYQRRFLVNCTIQVSIYCHILFDVLEEVNGHIGSSAYR